MMKRTLFLSSATAVLAAVLLSLFIHEDSITFLSSMAVGILAVLFALARCMRRRCPHWQTLTAWLAPAALFIGIACSHLPLRLVFRIYRPEFDQVAELIESGKPPVAPFWIGPFRIMMAGRRGDSGTPYLATNSDAWEINGFVKHPRGHGFNLWSCVTLDDSWSCISED